MRSSNPFRKKPFCNDWHFVALGVILLLVSYKHPPLYAVLGLYFIFLLVKRKMVVPVFVGVLLVVLSLGIRHVLKRNVPATQERVYVLDVVDEDTYEAYWKGLTLRVYEKGHLHEPGDILDITLEVRTISEKAYETDFDYQEYLYSKGISYSIRALKSEYVKSSFSLYYLKYKYMNYLKGILSEDSYAYVSSMVFGDNALEDSLKDSYSILGISHILAISGLHILFLYKIFSFILLKLFHYYHDAVPMTLLFLFVVLTGAPASAIRAALFVLLSSLNKKGEGRYTKLDILSISLTLQLLYNPYQAYSSGFLLSYLVSFVLIFSGDFLSPGHKLLSSYKSYYLIFLTTFPITINFTNRISLLSLALSPVLSILVTFILLPISYLLAVIPVSDVVLKYVFLFLNSYLEGICTYGIFIPFPSVSFYGALFYYLVFIILLYAFLKKKGVIFASFGLSLWFLVSYFTPYVSSSFTVTFTDCGQGDAIVIVDEHKKNVMMIDAYNSFSYMKSLGISYIDTLLITHSDADHIGDYEKILSWFQVGHIYYPLYDTKASELLKGYDATPLKAGDSFLFGDTRFYCLGPVNGSSLVNSNSLVLRCVHDGISYLFTGDMTEEEEEDVLLEYGSLLDSDVLKVAHHGSSTSSSLEFLSVVSPSLAVISVGEDNSYGLPDSDVVEKIEAICPLYLTKDCGNITLRNKNGHLSLSTYR